jgi:hypothetical protein
MASFFDFVICYYVTALVCSLDAARMEPLLYALDGLIGWAMPYIQYVCPCPADQTQSSLYGTNYNERKREVHCTTSTAFPKVRMWTS